MRSSVGCVLRYILPMGAETTGMIFWTDRASRSLDDALAVADLLISSPHGSTEIPTELRPWLNLDVVDELVAANADHLIAAVVRRWAETDPSVIFIQNPQPWFVSEPNAVAGIFRELKSDDEIQERAKALAAVNANGAARYERHRLELLGALSRQTAGSVPGTIATMSVHDTSDFRGAPGILSLANRGDSAGNLRPGEVEVTMDPERLRLLADSHRTAFRVSSHDDVTLNSPRVGGREIVSTARQFPDFDAVHVEYRRDFLTRGETDLSDERIDELAGVFQRTWLHYRASGVNTARS